MIAKNFKEIRQRVKAATVRRPNEADHGELPLLIAVAKGQSIEKLREALEAGQRDFGENYAQEFLEHHAALQNPPSPPFDKGGLGGFINWHFIGHLQRNKVKHVIDKVALIHSVDSLELAQEIDRRAVKTKKIQSVLIEVNLGEEESKIGVGEGTPLYELIAAVNRFRNINLQGLMTIPPYKKNLEDVRPYFRRLREIRDDINQRNLYKRPLSELSMGMTQDFEVAIEEGATIVRVGAGIFGERTN